MDSVSSPPALATPTSCPASTSFLPPSTHHSYGPPSKWASSPWPANWKQKIFISTKKNYLQTCRVDIYFAFDSFPNVPENAHSLSTPTVVWKYAYHSVSWWNNSTQVTKEADFQIHKNLWCVILKCLWVYYEVIVNCSWLSDQVLRSYLRCRLEITADIVK